MFKIATATLLAVTLALPALAADLSMDTVLGTDVETVRAALTDMGYEVRKAEREDGHIELYVVKDGTIAEIYVSRTSGKPVKIERK